MGRIIPYIMENKKCLKPPTSHYNNGINYKKPVVSNDINYRFKKKLSMVNHSCRYESYLIIGIFQNYP